MKDPSLMPTATSEAPANTILPTPSLRSVGAMLALAVMWGLSIPVTKLGLQTLPPLTLTALRFAIAVPLLLVLVLGRLRLPWRALRAMAGVGVLGVGFGQVAQTLGVVSTTASVGTIISATIPIFLVVFATLRLKQSVAGLQVLGLLAAFMGIAFVAFANGQGLDEILKSSAIGAAWLLMSAITIAYSHIWSAELAGKYGTMTVLAWSTVFGLFALVPCAAWEMSHVNVAVTWEGIASAAYLGVFVTVIGVFLWLNILRTVSAPIAAGVQFIQPIVGIAVSAALFGDTLGPWVVVGVILVLAGVALTTRSRR